MSEMPTVNAVRPCCREAGCEHDRKRDDDGVNGSGSCDRKIHSGLHVFLRLPLTLFDQKKFSRSARNTPKSLIVKVVLRMRIYDIFFGKTDLLTNFVQVKT